MLVASIGSFPAFPYGFEVIFCILAKLLVELAPLPPLILEGLRFYPVVCTNYLVEREEVTPLRCGNWRMAFVPSGIDWSSAFYKTVFIAKMEGGVWSCEDFEATAEYGCLILSWCGLNSGYFCLSD